MALDQMGEVGELFSVHLNQLDHLLRRATAEAWGNRELRTGTIGALSMIAANPGISQNDIVQNTLFDKSAVNAIVNGLEEIGWAYRRPSRTDRRRYELYATEEGQAALRRIVTRIKTIESRMLAGLTEQQRADLLGLLDRLHASITAASD
jgi:DNA-binding MarR family transcriptional regulator